MFAIQSRAYRGGLLLLLLTLVAVFVRVARWRMAQYAPPSPYSQYASVNRPLTETAARVEAGAIVQGPFTLLAVTRDGQNDGPTLPPGVKPEGPMQVAYGINQHSEGTGLWIDVQGGISLLTRAIPVDGARHVVPFGPDATFVATFTPTVAPSSRVTLMMKLAHFLMGRPLPPRSSGGGWSGSYGWYDRSGLSPLPDDHQPFVAAMQSPMASAGGTAKSAGFVFVPRRLSALFNITAQPKTASGATLGGPLSLECQPVNAHVLFVQLPAAYSDLTRRMTVTVTRAAGPADRAAWRLTRLPPAHRSGPDRLPPRSAVSFGALSIQGTAAEAEDRSGATGSLSRPVSGGSTPPAADDHPWSGVPTLDYVLRLRNSAPAATRQEWTVRTERVTPQWTIPPPPKLPGVTTPQTNRGVMERRVEVYARDPASGRWQEDERQVGVAYPGQQHWLRLDGVATRTGYRFETVTLHDADVAFDPAVGHWRVSWRRAQTVTTLSGVSVTTLNARPVPPRPGPRRWSGLQFSTGGDHAEMYLAWHLPSDLTGGAYPQDSAPRQAFPPGAFGPIFSDFENEGPVPDWHDVWVPGATLPALVRSASGRMVPPPTMSTALGPLIQGGWTPLHYGLRLGGTPPALGYPSVSGAPPGPVLPNHLDAITFRVYYRAPLERHPFTLVLPVTPRCPP